MSVLGWIRRNVFRLAEHDPEKDPFTMLVNTDANGIGGPINGAVGSYNIKIKTADGRRHYDVVSVNGHKGGNVILKEGPNDLKFVVRVPSFGYLVEPNGPLNVHSCRTPELPPGIYTAAVTAQNIQTKFIVYIHLPRKSPITRYKDWWNVFWSARPNAYADYEIYLAKEDDEGKIIKVMARPEPGTTLNRLRILDRREDNAELQRLTDVRYNAWVGLPRNRGYVLRAVFTNDELRAVERGRYKIMVHVQHGSGNDSVDQGPHLEIGYVEFIEGVEETIELKIVRISPEDAEKEGGKEAQAALGADTGEYALFRIVAKYKEGGNSWKPNGLDCTIISDIPISTYDARRTVLPLLPGARPGTYGVRIDSGRSPILRVNAPREPRELVISAEMANSNTDEMTIDFHELKIEHMRTDVSDEDEDGHSLGAPAEGLGAAIDLEVRVVNPLAGDKPIRVGRNDAVQFSVDSSLARLRALDVSKRPLGRSASIVSSLLAKNTAIAYVRVVPERNINGPVEVTVTFGNRAKPIKILVNFTPIVLSLAPTEGTVASEDAHAAHESAAHADAHAEGDAAPVRAGPFRLCADGYGTFGIQIKAKDVNSNARRSVKVMVTLSGVALGTSQGKDRWAATICDDPEGRVDHGQRHEYTTRNDGSFLFYVRAGTTEELLTVTAITRGGVEATLTLDLKHPVIKIIDFDTDMSEHESHERRAESLVHGGHGDPHLALPSHDGPTDDNHYAFSRDKEYLIIAEAKWPGSPNLVRDGTVIMFMIPGEMGIGEFKEHGRYKFAGKSKDTAGKNQVHVKTRMGVAKVQFKVGKSTTASSFKLLATVPYSANQDSIVIPIAPDAKEEQKHKQEEIRAIENPVADLVTKVKKVAKRGAKKQKDVIVWVKEEDRRIAIELAAAYFSVSSAIRIELAIRFERDWVRFMDSLAYLIFHVEPAPYRSGLGPIYWLELEQRYHALSAERKKALGETTVADLDVLFNLIGGYIAFIVKQRIDAVQQSTYRMQHASVQAEFKSIRELCAALQRYDANVFVDHFTSFVVDGREYRNGFAYWVHLAFGDDALTVELNKASDSKVVLAILVRWLELHYPNVRLDLEGRLPAQTF